MAVSGYVRYSECLRGVVMDSHREPVCIEPPTQVGYDPARYLHGPWCRDGRARMARQTHINENMGDNAMGEHTPVPLYVSSSPDYFKGKDAVVLRASDADCGVVVAVFTDTPWRDSLVTLFAAAPVLPAALERSLDWLASYPGGGASEVYDQAREAIRKAKGEAS